MLSALMRPRRAAVLLGGADQREQSFSTPLLLP